MTASYIALYKSGELKTRADKASALLKSCIICPRQCKVNRLSGELGKCCTGMRAVISSYGPHFGEEAPLVGTGGSGTIFFSYCNLKCIYCQNYTISQEGQGNEASAEKLATIMVYLQAKGCSNINLVSPSHVVPQILEALVPAVEKGLNLPLVYNSGGYDSAETLRLLDGVVDIYMPDMKYSAKETARRLSGIDDYPQTNREAVKEMHRQVGDLVIGNDGIATRGLLVRHLVLPGDLAGTEAVMRFISEQISTNTYLNVMDQYRPEYRAYDSPELSRSLSMQEWSGAINQAQKYGLNRLAQIESRFRLI
jgi:putative pyruvate formate lyase activating enzyme